MNRKINKYIEIVIIPDNHVPGTHRNNVGITLNPPVILSILSQRYEKVSISTIETSGDLSKLIAKKPDLVFSGIKYFEFDSHENAGQESIWFSDYLSKHSISSIGSTAKAYRNSYDKVHAKKIVREANINTADFFITQPDDLVSIQSVPISFPLFVKPDEGGDSRGVDAKSIVTEFKALQEKVLDIYQNHQRASLVETYLSGKEYTVGVFENIADEKLTAMPIEIIPGKNKNGHRILDFEAKMNDNEEVIAVTDSKIHTRLSDFAIQAFKALKATSHGRIDIKLDGQGIPYFLEGNLMPGLGKGYLYRSYAFNQKKSYEQMIYRITDNALLLHNGVGQKINMSINPISLMKA